MDRPPRQGPPQSALFSGASRPQREERPPAPPRNQYSESGFSTSSKKSNSDESSPHRGGGGGGASYINSIPYDPSASSSHLNPGGGGGGGPKVQFSHPSEGSSSQHHLLAGDVPIVGYSNMTGNDFKRKRSLVRPDRERVDENHRLYNYRQHAAAMEAEGRGTAAVSRTGHYASAGLPVGPAELSGQAPLGGVGGARLGGAGNPSGATVRRGKSILAREEGMANETGLSIFKRGGTLRRPTLNRGQSSQGSVLPGGGGGSEKLKKKRKQKQPISPWMMFCLIVTACCPSPILRCVGEFSFSFPLPFSLVAPD